MNLLISNVCRSGLKLQTFTKNLQLFSRMTSIDRLQGSCSAVRQLHVSSAVSGSAGEGFHRCSQMDKKILFWTKMYPTFDNIPDEVTNTKMKKAKDIFRIRVNIMMALATALACVLYIIAGKQAAERGESVSQQNRDRHEEFQKAN